MALLQICHLHCARRRSFVNSRTVFNDIYQFAQRKCFHSRSSGEGEQIEYIVRLSRTYGESTMVGHVSVVCPLIIPLFKPLILPRYDAQIEQADGDSLNTTIVAAILDLLVLLEKYGNEYGNNDAISKSNPLTIIIAACSALVISMKASCAFAEEFVVFPPFSSFLLQF